MLSLILRGARLAAVDGLLIAIAMVAGGRRPAAPAAIPPFASPWQAEITTAATRHGVDPLLLAALVLHESGNDPAAVGAAGEIGLGQLMPATAAQYGVADRLDPAANLDGAAAYLADMLARYEGDTILALAAYNAGPGKVDKYGGVPPFSTTQHYVRIVPAYRRAFALYRNQSWRVTQGWHGLAGWKGIDTSAGCGAALYAPIGGTITYNGPDGYIGPYGGPSSMLTISGVDESVTLLHGNYLPRVGQPVVVGDLIGYEAAIGNATGCHTHQS